MPKRFTPEQFAASALGELRTHESFEGDTQAWHTYQDTVYSKLRPGEALGPLHANRAALWKAAARQLKKIEAEINTPVKKLKLSTRKQYPGVTNVQLGSPRPSACGKHVICQLTANVNGYGSCSRTCTTSCHQPKRRREREGDQDAVRPPSAPGGSRAQVARLRAQFGRQLSSSAVQTAWPPRVWLVLFKRSEADKVMYVLRIQKI